MHNPAPQTSYASALKDVAESAKELFHSEVALIKAELSASADRIARHTVQGALFGALLALSLLPFMAFLVLGLGELLDGRYWLSSLIVSLFFGSIGGYMTWHAYNSLRGEDLSFPLARRGLEKQVEVVQEKVLDIKETVTGESDGPTEQFTHSRRNPNLTFSSASGTPG